jgi:hypothetical protein
MAEKSDDKSKVIAVELTAEEVEEVAGGQAPEEGENFYTTPFDKETNYCSCHRETA